MFIPKYSIIDVASWDRREHFEKWIQFDEPFHGVTVHLDMTSCYRNALKANQKVFPRYMYHFLLALNDVDALKYRLVNKRPVLYDEVESGLVVMRDNNTFAYGHIRKLHSYQEFCAAFEIEKNRIKERGTLHDNYSLPHITHFSVLPWTNFISLSHARKYGNDDSIPKITFGKITEQDGKYIMPMSIHVHHALVDGYDVAKFIECFQNRLIEDLIRS